MDSVYLYNKYGEPISYDLWVALGRQLDWLEKHWDEADCGVWEVRGPRQRFTYSSLMTWVAFERAGRIAQQRGLPAPLAQWRDAADRAYLHVQECGWNPARRAYVQYPGSTTLDAGALVMPLVQFSGPSDPRFLSTLERIEDELVVDSLVHRYHNDGSDGFTEPEGTFNLCSFWYVEALTRAGRLDRARHTFEKMLTYANHLGLYAEEMGPPVRRWATSRRPSPTWPSSARPSTSTRPWRHDRHARGRTAPARPLPGGGAVQVHPGSGVVDRHDDAVLVLPSVSPAQLDPGARAAVGAPAGPDPTGRRRIRYAAWVLTEAEPEEVPDFALLLRVGGTLLVLVHGDVTVSVDGPDPATLNAAESLTWLERRVEAPYDAVTVTGPGGAAGSAGVVPFDLGTARCPERA